ncbi:HEAT repeat domain-containing protein [Veronia nyctiphanis]|uniref:HEAT repeat domain-containing protein n=1 Tax=Veronia nyctiphanis TaxID=1278244 RepID=UPI00100BBFF8|nr:HEAT repeat domain-containing protein [Veronia nyctiphanis]
MTETNQITYENTFTMRMGLSENLNNVQSNVVSFRLAFKRINDVSYLGIAYDLKPIYTNSESAVIETDIEQLGFTVSRNINGKITDIDLLGLPQNHPYGMVKHVVSQLSFLPAGTEMRYSLEDGIYHYEYTRESPSRTSRRLIEIDHQNIPEDLINRHNESWYVKHEGTEWPKEMLFNMQREVQFQGRLLAVEQNIESKRVISPELALWSQETLFAQNANAGFTVPMAVPEEENIQIANVVDFQNALMLLDANLDPAVAKAMGLFMLEEQTPDEIMSFLMDDALPTEHHAHIIYALQKAGTPLAEEYLGEIASNADISTLNRTRAIVSSGLFDGASQTSIDSLYNLMSDNEQSIANAASLNLGTIAKRTPKFDQQIGGILLNKLKSDSDPYMALLSISNINNPAYDKYVIPYAKDSRFHVRAAAYSIIARRNNQQNNVLTALLSERHPKVIDSIANTLVKFQNVPVPSTFLPHLRSRITGDGPPVISSRLVKFYLALKVQFNQTDIQFLRGLISSKTLSESDRSDISKALFGL